MNEKRASIRIGDTGIDFLSGPESLTYLQNKDTNILLFGDSYSDEEGFCDRCTFDQKCMYMEGFLDLWKKNPESEGDFVFESKKFIEEVPTASASSSSVISPSVPSKINDHYINVREIPNIKTLIDYSGLKRVYKKLDDIDRKVTVTNSFVFTEEDIHSLWNLCGETQKYFRLNEYNSEQLTELMKMYVYSDNFTDKLADVVIDQTKDTLKIGTTDISEITSGSESVKNVHNVRLQILKLKDVKLQLLVLKWFNETLSKYVTTYITDSSVTPGLVHALSMKSTSMQFGNALGRFKKCITNMMKLCNLLVDTYTIATILNLMSVSKNIIVYMGGYHVETYRDFLRQYFNMPYITAPKTGPRCLDLSDFDIEITP
ncbi:MAG: hypothetical protein M1480_06590 [Bacteroidetes bacterium]|nr:hypothetical protein [Bacteroidota bacterium]